jgi:hypothetical protein
MGNDGVFELLIHPDGLKYILNYKQDTYKYTPFSHTVPSPSPLHLHHLPSAFYVYNPATLNSNFL